jgi:cell division protein FtsA
MNKALTFSAIDIGTSKIATIIASVSEETGKINVIGASSVPSRGLRKSQVVDIEEAIEAITASVESAERMAGTSLSSAFISVGGGHIQSQNSKGVVAVSNPDSEIVGDDLQRVIEAARAVSLPSSREIIHVVPRNFKVDSQEDIKDPLGMTGVRLEAEAHIITGSSTAMRNLAKCVNEIGVEINALVFSGLAASESALTQTEKELGVCLVDIGGGTTSISIFTDSSLSYSTVLPVGAKNITNDLAIGLRVSLETAEKVKLALSGKKKEDLLEKKEEKSRDEINLKKMGLSDEVDKVSYKTLVDGIIRPRLNEIFTLVGEELKKSGFGGATPAGIVICGGGAKTIGVADACKRVLSLPVRVAEPEKLTGLIDDISGPAYAVSHGLILYGMKNAQQTATSFSFDKFGRILNKIPVKGAVGKTIDFVKSFLP